jgi:hypothetical protein
MALVFSDPVGFSVEVGAVAVGASVAGAVVGTLSMLGVVSASLPVDVAAGAAAVCGGCIAAAVVKKTPAAFVFAEHKPVLRTIMGAVVGAVAAVGCAALSWRLNLGPGGVVGAGTLGGLVVATLLSGDGVKHRASQLAGLVGAVVVGGVGGAGLHNAARFAASEGASVLVTTTALAGLMGLWVAAAAGLRRLQPPQDPLRERAATLLETLADPVRRAVLETLGTWAEIHEGLAQDPSMSPSTADETRLQAEHLVRHVIETATTWGQIHRDLTSPKVRAVDDKLKDCEARLSATTDEITKAHLLRALAALMAQHSAVDGLRLNMSRAEAAIDAQQALLERLRLAVVQHRVSDRERFMVELAAVSEQASRLSDDLETLAAAVAETESLADRRALADVERDARRSLQALTEPALSHQHAVADVAVAARAPR